MAGGFKPDRRGIEQLRREMTRELNRGGPLEVQVTAVPSAAWSTPPTPGYPATYSGLQPPPEIDYARIAEQVRAGQQPQTVYNGPTVIITDSNGSQVAINARDVNQAQQAARQVPGEYEALVHLLRDLVVALPSHPVSDDDREVIEGSVDEVLAEVVAEEPNKGRIRRGLAAIKGGLLPLVGKGVGEAVTAESHEWAQHAIDGLSSIAF